MSSKNDLPPLATAAHALDDELQQFERLTQALMRLPLTSEKNLERAASTLKSIAESDERLGKLVVELVSVISKARDGQQVLAGEVQARAEQLRERTQAFSELRQDFESLGQLLSNMNGLVHLMRDGESATDKGGALIEAEQQMGEAASRAEQLAAAAQEREFPDLAREADGMRQQLLAAKNKLSLLRGKLNVV